MTHPRKPFNYYAHRYNEPLHLRPDNADQKIIDAIRRDLESRGEPSRNSDIIRAALRSYPLTIGEVESAPAGE